MATVTQPLRDEHRDLFPQLEMVWRAAEAVDEQSNESLTEHLDAAMAFLTHLLVHAQAEERALYPVVARVMGAPEATATMSRDHVEIERLVREAQSLQARLAAGAPTVSDRRELRGVLYGLHALINLHFAKEEEVYLPILDARLPGDEAAAMFAAMEREAGAAASRLQ